MANPFFYGNPVPSEKFTGRRRALRRVVGRLVNQGQSSALVGEPRSGKTSLLDYVAAAENHEALYGADRHNLLFSYLDAQALGGGFSQAQFWQDALRPLDERLVAPHPDSQIALAYQACLENDFGNYVLGRLFEQVYGAGRRLVLLLDEFDNFLHHPVLNNVEFFGGLRSLASRSRGALALVTASRQSLSALNKETQALNPTGSPYFNFLDEITLGPFSQRDVAALLREGRERFTAADRRFIAGVGGGHPYLLQVAASALWEAYEDERDTDIRRTLAGEELFAKAADIMSDTWRLWSPATRRAIALVGLAHAEGMVGEKEIDVDHLLRDLANFGPELRGLKKQGFIAEDEAISGGWRVRPGAFLWWLTDELLRQVREERQLDEWLRQQEWEGLLKRGEKERLAEAIRVVGGMLREGATTLIKAAAEGAGRATVGG
jgi:hypothetical protein